MVTIATIQSYIDGGYNLTAYCSIDESCRHSAQLDLPALAKKLGPDFNCVTRHDEFLSRLVCSKCGRKGMQIRVGAPSSYRRSP